MFPQGLQLNLQQEDVSSAFQLVSPTSAAILAAALNSCCLSRTVHTRSLHLIFVSLFFDRVNQTFTARWFSVVAPDEPPFPFSQRLWVICLYLSSSRGISLRSMSQWSVFLQPCWFKYVAPSVLVEKKEKKQSRHKGWHEFLTISWLHVRKTHLQRIFNIKFNSLDDLNISHIAAHLTK